MFHEIVNDDIFMYLFDVVLLDDVNMFYFKLMIDFIEDVIYRKT